MNIVVVIPARKNSKRLKMKNKLKLGKKNLVERTINFANKINFTKKIIFTSDDNYKFKNKNTNLLIIKRPKRLATKNSKMFPVILNALKQYNHNLSNNTSVLLLQPTSPFRSLKLLKDAFILFKKFNLKFSVVCVSKKKIKNKKNAFKIKNNFLQKMLFNRNKEPSYEINGNFYFASMSFLKKYKKFVVSGKTIPIITNNKRLMIDIDTNRDYLIAKRYI